MSDNKKDHRPENRWTNDDGIAHTVNPTNDPRVPGGYYHTQSDKDGKATAVYNADGTLADIPQNKGYKGWGDDK
jgi:hypothetical protein